MIDAYLKYFQKSKIFLYPLLDIKKNKDYVPTETYICWDNIYTLKDYKYICIYNSKRDLKFQKFENKVLKHNKNLNWYGSISEDKQVYVFDYSEYKHDYEMFIKGSYSKISINSKNKILNYFGKIGNISSYIKSYLNPEEYHNVYAEALLVNVEIIKKVHEICTPPNLKKETLFEKKPLIISLMNNNSIYLEKTNI